MADQNRHQRTTIAEAVSKRNRDMFQSWTKPDATDAFLAFFVSDDHPAWTKGESRLVINNQAWGSRKEMEEMLRPMLKERHSTDVKLKDESVAVIGPDAVIHFSHYTFTTTDDKGKSPEAEAAATGFWTHENGQWKLLHYIQSWPSPMRAPGA